MNTTLVIYHRADFDGICSREIARKALGDSADYLGWDYGDDLPNLAAYQEVYLIDISLPPGVMALHADKLIWIDHHKSAIEAMKGVDIKGYRIDGVAACRLAWQWFFARLLTADGLLATKQEFVDRKVSEPYSVQLLGEFDIWCKTNEHTDLFQFGMQAEKSPDWICLFNTSNPAGWTNDGWNQQDNAYLGRIIGHGRVIQTYTDVMNAQMVTERGFDLVFEGLSFRVLNTRCNSMAFTAALKPHHDGCMAYYWNGSKWRFSLYGVPGKPNVDLSIIAVKHGGGGHKQACGFELSWLPRELGGSTEGVQVGNV